MCNLLYLMRHRNFDLLLYLSIVLLLSSCVAAQKDGVDITNKGEVSLKFQHQAKEGATKTYIVDRTRIPNAPKIPNSYRPLNDKGYLVSTVAIDLGRTTAYFKVPANTVEEFSRIRVLRLIINEIAPEGFEWQDCTTSLEVARSQRDLEVLEENKNFDEWYTSRMEGLLPNFASRTITCRPDDKWKNDEYFVLASKIGPPPSQPFTNLKFSVMTEYLPDVKEAVYRVSIKNTGQKTIANLSIFSRFDVDTAVKKIVPSQGTCSPSASDVSGRIVTCQLGRVASGSELTLEFHGSETGMSSTMEKERLNAGWRIDAYFVENLGDPFWGANRVEYRPMKVAPK